MSTTIGELTSRKSLDFGVWFLDMVQRYRESTYEQGERGLEDGRRRTDVPLQRSHESDNGTDESGPNHKGVVCELG
jgi:hypothetical protein